MTDPLEEVTVECPWCGAVFDTPVDAQEAGDRYVEDCPTCCAPIEFHVAVDNTGRLQVTVQREGR
ncbi:CPXCG motif-containing cysteine-rich protein [Ectothiorhodospira mobilis]|jgi:hypothetical protein|uniref:Cysteine-rich CPXCG n=1 Tax=Ectothiorhodospira mobilis TaxID=195064 RepID=A0A1I4PDD9_ECTMO|nr:CPXCG motif-containing cysteine-rich protein [Ectothiorhodospira mobilis]MCG5534883.1 CPXCG motif-containing cysteine-rich protein [Ectothiorhodospira mobilis]SFM25546.1 Cysteine-rich CPXCG [Ectothiorhodospira mobilis]